MLISNLTQKRKVDRMNAWSLLYDVMSEDFEHSEHYYDLDRNKENTLDLDLSSQLGPRLQNKQMTDNTPHFWKYEEDKTLSEVRDYLSGTYKSHYTSQESKTQTLDLIEAIGDAEAFTRSNAIKYLSRFGKKDGKSKLDILKAIHYCILLYHFADLHKTPTNRYETF